MFELKNRGSMQLNIFPDQDITEEHVDTLIQAFDFLARMPIKFLAACIPGTEILVENKELLGEFVEGLYNYWRAFVRIMPL